MSWDWGKFLFPDKLKAVVQFEPGYDQNNVLVELKQYASKLPTWVATDSSQGKEDIFRLRFFVVKGDGSVEYYWRDYEYDQGKAPLGRFNANDCVMTRESRLEFSLTTLDGSRRLWIRCMSEALCLQFMTACSKVGATSDE